METTNKKSEASNTNERKQIKTENAKQKNGREKKKYIYEKVSNKLLCVRLSPRMCTEKGKPRLSHFIFTSCLIDRHTPFLYSQAAKYRVIDSNNSLSASTHSQILVTLLLSHNLRIDISSSYDSIEWNGTGTGNEFFLYLPVHMPLCKHMIRTCFIPTWNSLLLYDPLRAVAERWCEVYSLFTSLNVPKFREREHRNTLKEPQVRVSV